MFAVLFELTPREGRAADCAKLLREMRQQVENVHGFESSERFASRSPRGRLLVVSYWSDERSIANYRANQTHHGTQLQARRELLDDYRVGVGRIINDAGAVKPPAQFGDPPPRRYVAIGVGYANKFDQITPAASWYDSLYEPGKALALSPCTLESAPGVLAEMNRRGAVDGRVIAISRDYGMFDRDDAPQFLPPTG